MTRTQLAYNVQYEKFVFVYVRAFIADNNKLDLKWLIGK